MKKDDTFESERLLFRGINEGDAELLVKWRSDPEVILYFRSSEPITVQKHLYWYERYYRQNLDRFDFIMIQKKSGQLIGTVGASNFRKESSTCEISYMIAEEACRRKGYAVEAIAAIISRLQRDGFFCFYAEIHRENDASIRTVKKLGFQFLEEHPPFCIYRKREDSYALYPR